VLAPQERGILHEALRPPEGYTLDRAVGTTYSLDLIALLAVPLAFTLFECEDEDGQLTTDPIVLLEAVRRHGRELAIFCQAGQIMVPRQTQLLGYLEESVVTVRPPNERGVFHPKVWVLRYLLKDQPVRYRVLCLTRNLTFDRSWDTLLVLEGELKDRTNAFAVNHPLADFVRELPALAITKPVARVMEACEMIQTELRRVAFDLPEGFEKIAFWPLGLRGSRKWPFDGRIDRMLVISPFLSPGFLERISERGKEHILVSNIDALSSVTAGALKGFKDCFAFAGEADVSDSEVAADEARANEYLSGLHAKLYVADAGWDARIWTGSANATEAAYSQNVEFLVELQGKKSGFGIDALMRQEKGNTGLVDLLQPFKPTDQAVAKDPTEQKLEEMLEQARRAISSARLRIEATPAADGRHDLYLRADSNLPGDVLGAVETICWPVTLAKEAWARPLAPNDPAGVVVKFSGLSFEALSAFVAFEVRAREGEQKASTQFVLNLPAAGFPADREERLLTSFLTDRSRVLRYLYLLLADEALLTPGLPSGQAATGGPRNNGHADIFDGLPLFEAMLKNLEHSPEKLDQVARLIADLRRTPEGSALLPEDFERAWQPIWAVREELRRAI
jgi:hypothetical protein